MVPDSKRRAAFLVLSVACATLRQPIAAQGLSPFLPSASRSRASGLLSIIDATSEGIERRRAAALEAMGVAESEALAAFAAAAASGGGQRWAGPDGRPSAREAAAAFSAARERAIAAARAIATGTVAAEGDTVADLAGAREAAASKLSSLISGAPLDERSQAGIAKFLLGRAQTLARLFPEALEVGAILEKGGRAGRTLWIEALAKREGEAVGARLLAARADAVRSAPQIEGCAARLEAALGAYRNLVAAFPQMAYPAQLLPTEGSDAAPFRAAIESLNALPEGRAASLLEAMDGGDGRDRAVAASARHFAALVDALPPARLDSFARLSGLPRSELFRYAELARVKAAPASRAGLRSARPMEDALEICTVWSALAQRELEERAAAGKAGESGGPRPRAGSPDPLLPLLGRPDLLELARIEPRFSRFYVEAGSRLGALYRLADSGAIAALASDAAMIEAAARALGETPVSLAIEPFDIEFPAGAASRTVAFRAVAAGSQGSEIFMPIDARAAASAYAKSFAQAFGISADAAEGRSERLLEEYGQRVASACSPAEEAAFILDVIPEGARFGRLELESALLEGWMP